MAVLAPSALTCPFPQHLRGAGHCVGPGRIQEIFTSSLGWIYMSLFKQTPGGSMAGVCAQHSIIPRLRDPPHTQGSFILCFEFHHQN